MPTAAAQRARRLVLVSLAAALALLGASLVLKLVELSRPWDVLVALVPVPLFAWMMVDMVDLPGHLDEFQKRIQLEALSVGFMGTAIGLVAWGQLERVGVLPHLNLGTAFAGMCAFYIVGVLVARRRYCS